MGYQYKGFERPSIEAIYDDMFSYGGTGKTYKNFLNFYSNLPDVITEDIVRVSKAAERNSVDDSKKYYSIHDDVVHIDYALCKQDIISSYIDSIFKEAQSVPVTIIDQKKNEQAYQISNAFYQSNVDPDVVDSLMRDYLFGDEIIQKNGFSLSAQESSILNELKTIFEYKDSRPLIFRNCMSAEYLSSRTIEWTDESGNKQTQTLADAINVVMEMDSGCKGILELLIYGTSRIIPGSQSSDGKLFGGYAALQTIERADGKTNGETFSVELLSNNHTEAFGDSEDKTDSLSLESLLSSANPEAILSYVKQYSTKILDYDLTPNKYFCGNDAYVFLNGVRVGEVTYIDWTLTERKQPIYGYASYTFDDIAVGTRSVTGKISVNFTKTRYLDGLQIYNNSNIKDTTTSISPIVNSVQDIFNALDKRDGDNAINGKKAFIKTIMENREDEELAKVIRVLEDQLLTYDSSAAIVDKSQQPYFNNPRADGSNEGFTIMIPWGDELFKMAGLESNGNETLTIINDVYITSESSEVTIGAENVQQVFTYIARDLNNTILTKEEKIDIYNLQSTN